MQKIEERNSNKQKGVPMKSFITDDFIEEKALKNLIEKKDLVEEYLLRYPR